MSIVRIREAGGRRKGLFIVEQKHDISSLRARTSSIVFWRKVRTFPTRQHAEEFCRAHSHTIEPDPDHCQMCGAIEGKPHHDAAARGRVTTLQRAEVKSEPMLICMLCEEGVRQWPKC